MTQPNTPAVRPAAAPSRLRKEDAPGSGQAGRPMSVRPGVKTFVLDTNVLLHDPNALFVFDEHDLIIPFDVVEELDGFKNRNDDLGRAARETIRHLDALRQRGVLADGVDVIHPTTGPTGGRLQVVLDTNGIEVPGLREPTPDNHIIRCSIKMQHQGRHAVFVSKDIAARIKAHAMGVEVADYENKKVNFDGLYTGYREATVPSEAIDRIFADDEVPAADLGLEGVLANEFVQLQSAENPSHNAIARATEAAMLRPVRPHRRPIYGILGRNLQQQMALDLLMDDDVKLVTLIGQAGTGKTLLALAAGMQRVVSDGLFSKLLAARPIMPMGRDIGYLPGDKDEKLGAWMQPIFDNLAYLLGGRVHHGGDDKAHHTPKHKAQQGIEQQIDALMKAGTVVLEPLTYIRGRSIPDQFMIVDEAQNLTPHEIKTIASRVGEGTKLVFTGDPTQIDNPYLDASSNGLTYLVEKLKGRELVGHVTLAKSERSELASLAAEAL